MAVLSESPRPVLSVLDWAVACGGVFAITAVLVEAPTGGAGWMALFVALLVATTLVAVAGLLGRAPWRVRFYPIVTLVTGTLAVWTNGPLAGVGVVLAFAVLVAAALGNGRLVIAVTGAALVAIALRAAFATGLWGEPTPGEIAIGGLRLWGRIALTSAVVMWVAVRVLEALNSSLEQALDRTADAYRAELAMQAQLDDRRQELDDLEEVELVGRLAGGVAHDVNNALTSIMAASEVLADDVQTDRQRVCLVELESASQRAAELVRDLLWIGRKFPPTTQTADLYATIDRCITRLHRMSRQVALRYASPAKLRVALAPERLEQVLFWLVVEAERTGIRALHLTSRRDGSELVVELAARDAIAVAPGRVAKHAQLRASAALDVIEQVGGRLTISGAGDTTVVELRLPAAAEPDAVVEPAAAGSRALVVDDEPLILERLARLVAARGYRVVTAASLADAWPKLDAGCDLLVTDLQLGDGRGQDLAVASFARAPERPIVICSGFGADDALRDRLRGARLAFLTKPFTRDELEHAIAPATKASA
jgi:CheY-like chemotaxis protein/signal transduction histidine kinase